MPPEAFEGKSDARGDVYSLGLTLYEMLAFRPAFDEKERGRLVKQVSESLTSAPGQAQPRRPARPGDDRPQGHRAHARRSVRDGGRAGGRPPAVPGRRAHPARRASLAERYARWARHHPEIAILGGVLTAVLVVATIGSLTAAARFRDQANQQKLIAAEREIERMKAEARRVEAETARAEADLRRAEQKAVIDFLLHDMLGSASPELAQGRTVTVAEVLAAADRAIEGKLKGQPLVEATVRQVLGNTYRGLGELDKAAHHLKEALALRTAKLGAEDRETLMAMGDLAQTMRFNSHMNERSRMEETRAFLERTLELQRRVLGEDDPATLTTMHDLADALHDLGRRAEAQPLHERALEARRRILGPEHPDTLQSMNDLADVYRDSNQFDRAKDLYEKTLALDRRVLGPEHPKTLTVLEDYAELLVDRAGEEGQRGLKMFEEAVAGNRKVRPKHPLTRIATRKLADHLEARGKAAEACTLLEAVEKMLRESLGPDHPGTHEIRISLASAYQAAGRMSDAIPLLEAELKAFESGKGSDDFEMIPRRVDLAEACQAAGRTAEAISLLDASVNQIRAMKRRDHPDTITMMNNIAVVYKHAGKPERAIPLYEEALKLRIASDGPDHPDTLIVKGNLGIAYAEVGRLAEALPLLEDVARASRKQTSLLWVKVALVEAYGQSRRFDKAAALAREQLAEARAALPAGSPQLAGVMASSGLALLKAKLWGEAEPLLRECLAIREKADPGDWRTFNTRSLLGGALLGQKKYAEAEPLLLQGYEGMKAREKSIPAPGRIRIPEALDRLIEFSTATNKPDAVKTWQAERAKYPSDASPKPTPSR